MALATGIFLRGCLVRRSFLPPAGMLSWRAFCFLLMPVATDAYQPMA